MPEDFKDISSFLELQEGLQFECKRMKGKLSSVVETVVAFANTNGGILACGLEDPDKAEGIDRIYGLEEKLENWDEIRRLLRNMITDPEELPVQISVVKCGGREGQTKSVGFLMIQRSAKIHSIVGDGTFTRMEKSNRQLTAPEISELMYTRGTASAESEPVEIDIPLLDTEHWKDYASTRRLTVPLESALINLGLARKFKDGSIRPTRAAVLLFADNPADILGEKCTIRILHYKGSRIVSSPSTNLLKPPKTVGGPLIVQINSATSIVIEELSSGIHMGPLGFEIIQKYPTRVIREAITNAVIHRDYSLATDIHIRIFSDSIHIESPGVLPGPVTVANIGSIGTFSRNKIITNNLREFSTPPNIDAGEGVPMMIRTMNASGLYPPLYMTPPTVPNKSVTVVLFNENRPSIWEQVSGYLDKHNSIGNAELRVLLRSEDTLKASKLLKRWVEGGQLVVANPEKGMKVRRYRKHYLDPNDELFSSLGGKQNLPYL